MKTTKNTFLLAIAVITCPCHLPFVLPGLAGLLAGTAIGAFVSENTALLAGLAIISFVGTTVYWISQTTDTKRNEETNRPERPHE